LSGLLTWLAHWFLDQVKLDTDSVKSTFERV